MSILSAIVHVRKCCDQPMQRTQWRTVTATGKKVTRVKYTCQKCGAYTEHDED